MAAPADARTLPFSWYSDEAILRSERARSSRAAGSTAAAPSSSPARLVPRRPTQAACRSSSRATDDGELRAFLNVCRHRGAVLTEGCGDARDAAVPLPRVDVRASTARCARRRAPTASRASTTTTGRCSPRASTRGGRSSSSTPTPTPRRSPSISASCRRSSRARSTSTRIVFHSRVEFGANANWKIVVENFLECYHCPTAHPGFSAEVDVHPDRYGLEAHPTFAAQFARAKATRRARPVPPALSEHRHQRLPRARPTSRSGRSRRTARTAPSATSTTSSRRASTRRGSRSSSPSTTRSGARTRRSSSRCTAAWPRACSSTAGCCSARSRCSRRSSAGSSERRLEPDAQRLAVELERAAELLEHVARDERAEIAQLARR